MDFEEVESQGLDLGEDAVERGGVRKLAGEDSLGTLLLGHKGRERRQQGGTEVAIYPDLVQDGVITHGLMVVSFQVSRHHRDPVIVGGSAPFPADLRPRHGI